MKKEPKKHGLQQTTAGHCGCLGAACAQAAEKINYPTSREHGTTNQLSVFADWVPELGSLIWLHYAL
ncbi:MAG: hypothetical protein JWM16_5234 [Verrucomicrobiales bacterium]|nr:hypothetical protein [Verrucomicrobiales bacterium]